MSSLHFDWEDAEEGLIGGIEHLSSPNQDERSCGVNISLAVVHYISVPAGRFGGNGIRELFTNALSPADSPEFGMLNRLRVSSHFLIDRNGDLVQFVPCARRAWHAGLSSWKGIDGCNDFSIGIELEGGADHAFEPAQLRALPALLQLLVARYPITDVVGHEHIAPGRKVDPGAGFPWGEIS